MQENISMARKEVSVGKESVKDVSVESESSEEFSEEIFDGLESLA